MIRYFFDRITESHVKLIRVQSDKGVYLKQVGTDILVAEAIEVEGSGNEYEETDIPIEPIEASKEDMLGALEKLGI